MKYMMLIYQGTTPTPRDPDAWAQLPEEDQQAVFRAYQELNHTPGVTPGVAMSDPVVVCALSHLAVSTWQALMKRTLSP